MDRPSFRRARAALLGGAAASLALWGWDLLSLSALRYGGVEASAAQAAVVRLAALSIARLELKLALTHLVVGASLGLLAAAALGFVRRGRPFSPRRQALAAAGVVLAVHLLALAGMVAAYPQLYAHAALSSAGMARVQYWLTHRFGPAPFDALLLAVLIGLAVLGVAALLSRASRAGGRRLALRGAAVAALTAVLLVLAGWHGPAAPHRAARPNLLVIGLDSLRADRIESSEVMPFTSSLAGQGALFTHAFTPIARTFPSWVSTLTGREPRHHGIRTMFPRNEDRRDIGPTFVSDLRDAGYRTFVVGDFAPDTFLDFAAGFETVDAPGFTVDTIARSSVLAAHRTTLPLLRLAPFRAWLGDWRNMLGLADPKLLVERTKGHLARRDDRPFAGVVFFETGHFPYAAPHPFFKWKAGDYRGRYLYQVPPTEVDAKPEAVDVEQIRHRYDGAVRAMDAAIESLVEDLRRTGLLEHTVVVIMGDHGEDLLEKDGIFGHGDTLGIEHSQYVPILIVGPGVPRGLRSRRQVRLYDLAPTVLGLLQPGERPTTYGDGLSLFAEGPRPICLETDVWFWPDRPAGLRGQRLTYDPVDRLLEVSPENREIVIRQDRIAQVEAYKERGLVWGDRMWHERPTPSGRLAEMVTVAGIEPEPLAPADLRAAFEERCVQGDPSLSRVYGNLVFTTPAP